MSDVKEGSFEENLEYFQNEVSKILLKTAQEKGYGTEEEGGRELYDFIHDNFNRDGHALGEIVYKAIRYRKKGEMEDLIKIAAWAFLIYDRRLR